MHESESGEYAASLLERTYLREKILNKPLVLHSDNGSPMKSYTMKAKMAALNVTSSYNRPRVSNDNPYSESLFKTTKYHQSWPSSGFDDLSSARAWVAQFVEWYNHEHQHSKINFVTPNERHIGADETVLAKRREVLVRARNIHPERWMGDIQNCQPIGAVTLNPDNNVA